MALITTAAREELIALFVAMFRAAPGATHLNTMVGLYEDGYSTSQIAAAMAARPEFLSVYPTLQTAEEFAASLIDAMLPEGTVQQALDYAENWILTNLAAGKSRGQIILEAVQAIRATDNPNYETAQTQLANRVEVATYYSVTKLQSNTSLAALQDVIAGVTADEATVEAAKAGVDDDAQDALGQTYTLTASVDSITAGSGNDVFVGQINAGSVTTITGLDNLNGGGGQDTVNIFDVDGDNPFPNVTLTSIETINYVSAGDADNKGGTIDFTTSKISGLENINVDASGVVNLKAGDAHAVTVNNSAGTVTAVGGASQNVSTAGGGFVLSGSKGAITVVDTNQNGVNSTVNGGTSVSVTTTDTATSTLTIGGTTAPTGAVTVVQNVNGTGNLTGGAIAVTGGTSVNVTVNATQETIDGAAVTTVGAINVTGNASTTSVSVTQTKAATAAAKVDAVAGVAQTHTLTFQALADGETTTVEGLTFTADGDLTAAQVAAAFANLAASTDDILTTQGRSVDGLYTGQLSKNFSSGAASGDTVTFTQTGTAGPVAIDVDDGDVDPTVASAGGTAAVKAAGTAGIANGAVTINGAAIASATLNGYANSTVTSDALTSLSLANATGKSVTVTNTKATTLALEVNNLGAASTLDAGGVYTALNLTASGANSTLAVTAGGVTALTVAGSKTATLTGLTALKTVTVSGAAGVTLAGNSGTLESVNTTASTGTSTVTIDATKATYTGGDGVDKVTTTAAAPTKAISLGGGNDTLTLAASSSTVAISGGDGKDTLSLTATNAAAADDSTAFASKVTDFEVLEITGGAGETIDVGILGFTQVSSPAGTLTINKLASGGSLTITGNSTKHTVNVTDAATGTEDVFNLTVSGAGKAAGTVTVADVETVNITSTATTAGTANTLTLEATKATAITITGNNALTLTNTGNSKVASIDASSLTGALSVQAAGTTATTITGGTGNDILKASTVNSKADTLIGGDGQDTLYGNSTLSVLTGGAGNDIFVASKAANVNSYTIITDASTGDRIQLIDQGVEVFEQSAVELGDTAVFQDYANAAINDGGDASANGYIAWFQFAGNTYIVQSLHDATATPDFQNGTDVIIRLNGLVDLSTASFNNDGGLAGPTLLV